MSLELKKSENKDENLVDIHDFYNGYSENVKEISDLLIDAFKCIKKLNEKIDILSKRIDNIEKNKFK
jgi:hypothetical protein